ARIMGVGLNTILRHLSLVSIAFQRSNIFTRLTPSAR
ncbi:hypothetical protein MX823_004753, partial [Escherichia coli]|nr:hypothetical protein [Escherichia coli]EJC1622132.1 hypothetical protein [Escherichia coli]EKE9488701.1 hypothetical protein [Escherichia coli]EKG8030119.1 hypothetical protein [Escherichia coli]